MDLRHVEHGDLPPSGKERPISRHLFRLRPHLRIAAIRDALPHATKDELETLHAELIALVSLTERQTPIKLRTFFRTITSVGEQEARPEHIRRLAVSLLASDWHRLPGTHRRLALTSERTDWSAALADLLRHGDAPCPASAALFVDLGPAAPPSALIRLIAATDRDTADTAERLLIDRASHLFNAQPDELPTRLTKRDAETPEPHRARGEPSRPGPAETASLVRAMLDAQEDHERSTPALIALAMLDRPATDPLLGQLAPLRAVLDDADHPAAPILRRLIRRDRSVMSRRLAWRLLAHPALGMPALERIAGASTAAEHEALLTNAHLVLHPARRRALAMLPTPREASARSVRTPTPIPAKPSELSVEARRGLARLAPALDVGPAVEPDAVHHAALVEPDRLARLMHARVAVGGQLADFCFDPDPAIARSAVLRWSAAGVSGQRRAVSAHRARLAAILTRSPHQSVRRLALDEPRATTPVLDTPRGRFTELLEAKPDRPLGDHLQDELLRTDDPARRVAIIGLAARSGVLNGWRDLLDEMTRPGKAGPLVTATIATALRTLPAPYPKDILARLLAHADPRVRANAVETLDRLLRRGVAPENARAAIIEAKASGEHRSRANAVRAETGRPTGDPLDSAGADLERMITDERPPHRLAGAWLAERVLCAPGMDRNSPAWQRAALRVARVARDEPDAHIRARAKRCARRLLTAVDRQAVPASRPDPAESATRAALERFAAQGSAGVAGHHQDEAEVSAPARTRDGAAEGATA